MRETYNRILELLKNTDCILNVFSKESKATDDFTLFNITANTPAGGMVLKLYPDWLHLKFGVPSRAVKIFGSNVNKFSGKHNYHPKVNNSMIMRNIFEWFTQQIDLLKKQ